MGAPGKPFKNVFILIYWRSWIIVTNTVELKLSGLIGTASRPNMQNIQIMGFFCAKKKKGYIGSLKFGCYYLQYVPAYKPFDHTSFEVLEAITLYYTSSDNQ